MKGWREVLNHEQAITMVLRCIDVMQEHEGNNFHGVTVCRGKKCFLDCMTIHEGKAMVWYNDKNGSTQVACAELITF
jgi:hypothetical protein